MLDFLGPPLYVIELGPQCVGSDVQQGSNNSEARMTKGIVSDIEIDQIVFILKESGVSHTDSIAITLRN